MGSVVSKRSRRAHERMIWLLRRMSDPVKCHGFIVAWDTYTVDAFVEAFPEAERTIVYYMTGPNSSPMLNAAAKRAEKFGYITAGVCGNEDARAFNQRTWCRTWRLTGIGRDVLKSAGGYATKMEHAG
jgi:hypothetical protein